MAIPLSETVQAMYKRLASDTTGYPARLVYAQDVAAFGVHSAPALESLNALISAEHVNSISVDNIPFYASSSPKASTTPPQAGSVPSSPTIPTPVITPAPVQVDRGTVPNPIISTPVTTPTVSTPSIFTQAKPILLVGVALFAAVTLFVTPKASKRK